jgi:hypothetical protein
MSSSGRPATALSNPKILVAVLDELDEAGLIAARSVNGLWSCHATPYFWRLASSSKLGQVPLAHCAHFAAMIELFYLTLPHAD